MRKIFTSENSTKRMTPREERANEKSGWDEWSKYILNELERLADQLESVRESLNKTNLDIAKLSFLNNNIKSMEDEIMRVRNDFKEAVASLKRDDTTNAGLAEDQSDALVKKVEELQIFMTRVKTIAAIVGAILVAIIGTLSFSVNSLLR